MPAFKHDYITLYSHENDKKTSPVCFFFTTFAPNFYRNLFKVWPPNQEGFTSGSWGCFTPKVSAIFDPHLLLVFWVPLYLASVTPPSRAFSSERPPVFSESAVLATEGVGRSTPPGWVMWSETPKSLLIHVGKTATLTLDLCKIGI